MKMKKIGLGISIGLVITVLVTTVALALPLNTGVDRAKGVSKAIDQDGNLVVPLEFAPAPFPQLAESELKKIVFIRYAPGFQKEKPCNENGVCEPELGERGWCSDCKGGEEPPEAKCYGFLSGAKPRWNWVEDYVYDGVNLATPSFNAVATWESPVSGDIFGSGVSGTYPWGVYDYINSISFGDYSATGVIAVTAIWFRGKNIYEYDIMFDTDYFPGTIDLDTVTLHEFGHGAGLDDLYDVNCSENVMYGYYTGIKTTLGNDDITGIQILYGK